MVDVIKQRLDSLREVMKREKMAAFIFPSTDAHQSEYVAPHWQGREWISGFNGSAGTAVVTLTKAALWTDSRYFLAAEQQLKGTEFQLMKQRVEGTPTIAQWLGEQLAEVDSPEVGLDGMVNSYHETQALIAELRQAGGVTVRTNFDPLDIIWKDRPSIPDCPVEIQPLEYAGETLQSKLSRIREALRMQYADGMLVSALDDIAWTLNLRGTDVHCVPVFVSYLLIASNKVGNPTRAREHKYLRPRRRSSYCYHGAQPQDDDQRCLQYAMGEQGKQGRALWQREHQPQRSTKRWFVKHQRHAYPTCPHPKTRPRSKHLPSFRLQEEPTLLAQHSRLSPWCGRPLR